MNFSFLKEKGSKYLIWILLGILVLVMIIPTENKEAKDTSFVSEQQTKGEMEEKLEQVLMAMEGVGNVKVMITLKESASDLFSEETEEGEVLGVVVVAEGAGRAEVDAKIMTSVEALFGIEAHKISIVKMRSQEVGK
jgi:stage III sporulation protein AG